MYLGGLKTISSDEIFIITSIRKYFHKYEYEFEGLLYTILSEEHFKNQIINIKEEKDDYTIPHYVGSEQTGYEAAEMGSWSGGAGADRDLGNMSRAARYQPQVHTVEAHRSGSLSRCTGGPRPEEGYNWLQIVVQLSIRVADGGEGGGCRYTEGEWERSRIQLRGGAGIDKT